jgi:hypothetical protein
MDVGESSVGGINVVLRDVFPSLVEMCERIGMGMEGVAAHPPDRRRSLFSRSVLNASYAVSTSTMSRGTDWTSFSPPTPFTFW